MRAAGWFAALALGGLTASQQPALRVLRVAPSPQTPGEPTSVVTVVFDRPVAGQLDGTVDPRTIFAIAPAVDGKVEWRDPITLRFTPATPLTPGGNYVVTVANTFRAMDGSRLPEPYRFGFRVGGPRVLSVRPVGPLSDPLFLPQDAQFELVVSAPVDLSLASRLVYLQLQSTCNAPPVVRLSAVTQRPLPQDTSRLARFRAYRAYGGQATELTRVVRLVPEQVLPRACAGSVMYPERLETTTTAGFRALDFRTYGPFQLVRVTCLWHWCPTGHARLEFSTPVHGADLVRAVTASPAVPVAVGDTGSDAAVWELDATLRPRTTYVFTLDSTLHDVFGQPMTGGRSDSLHTTAFMPMLDYPTGSMVVERQSYRTLAVKHVNVDTLFVALAPVPDSLLARIVAAPEWNLNDVWPLLAPGATERTIVVAGPKDVPLVSAVKMPAYNAALAGAPALMAVRISGSRADTAREYRRNIALVQVTDLAVAVKLGAEEAVAWVTTMHDGRPAPGAAVVLYDRRGRVRARGATDAQGLARLTALAPDSARGGEKRYYGGSDGYVTATLGSDRAVVNLNSWELSPWQFNVSGADQAERLPAAAAVFTERGIYRPGETVHAKAIVRTGALGALRVPGGGDSLHWVFGDREEGKIRDTTVALSAFGTADQALIIPADLPLGTYRVGVGLRRAGSWVELGSTVYRVAEYRPPEFLVSAMTDSAPHFAGDTIAVNVEARYLFGAPMARAEVTWSVRRTPVFGWGIAVPHTEGYTLGETGWWWEEEGGEPAVDVTEGRIDTTDASGHLVLHAATGTPKKGRAARVTVEATVTDVNRQTVSASASTTVHPAAFYVGAKPLGDDYFWRAGAPESIAVIAVDPSGQRVPGVAVGGTVVRREWHRVLRARAGLDEQVGEWVADTVARCDLVTAADPVLCQFTPKDGGSYVIGFRAKDAKGREASTSFYRWAMGGGWVPWEDESQFKMDVIPDKTSYAVGDTATVLFASPFTDAEAWITVEREGIIEQRRLRITSGATSLKLPLTEAYVPNAFVGIVVARGRAAPPGTIGDPGRPALRVGYAQLLVTPAVKRLKVDLQSAAEYRPGDTARVRLHVSDAAGTGARSEVTLWAVDEGVLALTGYRTPDPIALLYQPRGLGMRLGSDLVSVATQVLDSEGVSIKGDRAPGGGGGLEGGEVLRSRFASTAFYLGSVVTDANGDGAAAAKLPDNLTTFRLMAVAVTAGDRYGSGQSSLLVTRPLLARPALPRFLRRDDHFLAGVVVNQRAGGTPSVSVRARGRGVAQADTAPKTVTLAPGRGTEVRFDFRDTTSDTAVFRFDVGGSGDSDAVLTRLPVRPAYFPRTHAMSGTVRWRDTVAFSLPADIDPERSRVLFSAGTTPLGVIGGMYRQLAVYPFDCSEQVTDEMLPLIALLKAEASGGGGGGSLAPADARSQLEEGVATLSRRQRTDGGIGLWAAGDWTTPWLSAYAGEALLGARSVGVAVNDSVLIRLGQYLYRSVHQPQRIFAPVTDWLSSLQVRLAENVAAVDFLSRFGRADLAGENELLREGPQLAWEDRVRLAEVLARRGATDAGKRLLEAIWAGVRIEGRRAVIPDSAHRSFYFWSYRRPVARLLTATLAVDSANALVGPLVETLVEEERGASRWWWNTQDYGAAVEALAAYAERQRRAAARGFSVAAGGRQLFTADRSRGAAGTYSAPLTGLLVPSAGGTQLLSLVVAISPTADSLPLFYYASVEEVPLRQPVTPDQQGIAVERWYEDYATGRPIVSTVEGSLVRVRLRITIPAERRFLALSDPLPAGLEAVDLSLHTTGGLPGPGAARRVTPRVDEEGEEENGESQGGYFYGWFYGSWDGGWWSPFDHREMRDDRVAWFATYLWPGTYTASYVARATTPGVFVRPPAHAEEMYNPSVQGRTDGGIFTVTPKTP